MQRRTAVLLASLTLSCAACDPGSEAAFTRGRSLVPCDQNIPSCPGLFATCSLNSTTYARLTFPQGSPFRFLVAALPQESIELTLFFVTQQDVGLDTRILWYEPGCADVFTYESEGADLFAEAEETNTISRKQTVYSGGDHLIEVFTDMQAEVDIGVEVLVPLRSQ
ncbi:MAG: hypothetical protein HY903_12430 [Deltaproteobacteria bacterium]|nr:hypothetical protein [Deltaproteobacteria bacterium]